METNLISGNSSLVAEENNNYEPTFTDATKNTGPILILCEDDLDSGVPISSNGNDLNDISAPQTQFVLFWAVTNFEDILVLLNQILDIMEILRDSDQLIALSQLELAVNQFIMEIDAMTEAKDERYKAGLIRAVVGLVSGLLSAVGTMLAGALQIAGAGKGLSILKGGDALGNNASTQATTTTTSFEGVGKLFEGGGNLGSTVVKQGGEIQGNILDEQATEQDILAKQQEQGKTAHDRSREASEKCVDDMIRMVKEILDFIKNCLENMKNTEVSIANKM
jgi:hypothetical protein